MKKKLLVILGAGSSMSLGMPSVPDIDALMAYWARGWAAAPPGGLNYFEALRQAVEDYYTSRVITPCPPVTFEKVLGEMLAFSHWMTPSPWGDTLRHVVCGGGPPSVLLPDAGDHASEIALRGQLGHLSEKLARHMRVCSQKMDVSGARFGQYSGLFHVLRRSFDVGVFNLNYDDAALTAMPDAYTGFDKDGQFEPHVVHSRAEWNYVYHLHGSVHHSLVQQNINRICWRNNLAGEFVDSDGDTGPQPRSGGRLFPKSTLLMGGFKLDQLLMEPFHSMNTILIRHLYAADAILIGGYGLGDAHVNWALSNRLLDGGARPPVMILDRRSAMTCSLDGIWTQNLRETTGADASFFQRWEPHSVTPLEIAEKHRVAIWHGGFTEAVEKIDAMVAWLDSAVRSVESVL